MEDSDEFVEVGDDVPRLEEQARLQGWRAGIFDFGKGAQDGVSFFNPGMVRRPDGLWLIARRSVDDPMMPYGRNDICAFLLDEETMRPKVGYPLKVPDSANGEQFEDPRAFRWGDQTWIGMVNFTWFPDGSWTGAHQCLASYRDDEEWTPIVRRDPPVETNRGEAGHTNGRHNKNFLWFIHDGKLCLIYQSDPWHVVEFGATWEEQKHYRSEGVKYGSGHIRGGTTPVLVDGLYWSFFHSSLPWRGRFRRYYMGAYAFESKPPFSPVFVTPEPMLAGSQNNRWFQRKPLVVFPCGALLEDEIWTITFGSNDLESGWVKIPHEDVVRLAQPKPKAPVSLLLNETTPRPIFERIKAEEDFPVTKGESSGAIAGVTPKSGTDLPVEKCCKCDKPALYTCYGGDRKKGELGYCQYHVDRIADNGAGTIHDKKVEALKKARAELARKRALGLVAFKPRKRKKLRRARRKALPVPA